MADSGVLEQGSIWSIFSCLARLSYARILMCFGKIFWFEALFLKYVLLMGGWALICSAAPILALKKGLFFGLALGEGASPFLGAGDQIIPGMLSVLTLTKNGPEGPFVVVFIRACLA